MTRPFLITGCGRSGTTWAAALFRRLGYPCLHEHQFSPVTHGPLRESESSWLAIPYLDTLPARTPILRVMRDPYAVTQSAYARAFLSDPEGDPYARFVAKHRPDITAPRDRLARAIRWAALWDEPVADRRHAALFTGSLYSVGVCINHTTNARVPSSKILSVMRELGTQVNTNAPALKRGVPSREDIDAHPDGHLIRTRAEEFGFTD